MVSLIVGFILYTYGAFLVLFELGYKFPLTRKVISEFKAKLFKKKYSNSLKRAEEHYNERSV